jgi:phage shock protein PspC (stress-responsive transcriptional regulator)
LPDGGAIGTGRELWQIIHKETAVTETPTITLDEPPAPRRLTRARSGRWFGGVCAGLGRYFEISPAIYRLAFVALALAGGTGVLLYIAAWLVIPDEGHETSIAEQALRERRDRPGLAVGVGLLGLAAIMLFSHAEFWPHPGNFWLAALLVGGGLVWWELHGSEPAAARSAVAGADGGMAVAPPRETRPSLFLPVVGMLLAAAGIAGLLDALDAWSVDLRVAIGATVVVVGVAIVAGAATGRRVAGLVGLGLLLLPVLVLSLALHVPLRGGVGDRVRHPEAIGAVPARYRLAIGDLTVDLRDLALPDGETAVRATVGVGHVLVYVPDDVAVDVRGRAQVGDVVLLGRDQDGVDVDEHVVDGDGPKRLTLDLEVGIGQVEVRRP